MVTRIDCFPSYQIPLCSRSGRFVEWLAKKPIFLPLRGRGDSPPYGLTICTVAARCLAAIALVFIMLRDLIPELAGACPSFCCHQDAFNMHRLNIISFLSLAILSFAMPFGYLPKTSTDFARSSSLIRSQEEMTALSDAQPDSLADKVEKLRRENNPQNTLWQLCRPSWIFSNHHRQLLLDCLTQGANPNFEKWEGLFAPYHPFISLLTWNGHRSVVFAAQSLVFFGARITRRQIEGYIDGLIAHPPVLDPNEEHDIEDEISFMKIEMIIWHLANNPTEKQRTIDAIWQAFSEPLKGLETERTQIVTWMMSAELPISFQGIPKLVSEYWMPELSIPNS